MPTAAEQVKAKLHAMSDDEFATFCAQRGSSLPPDHRIAETNKTREEYIRICRQNVTNDLLDLQVRRPPQWRRLLDSLGIELDQITETQRAERLEEAQEESLEIGRQSLEASRQSLEASRQSLEASRQSQETATKSLTVADKTLIVAAATLIVAAITLIVTILK